MSSVIPVVVQLDRLIRQRDISISRAVTVPNSRTFALKHRELTPTHTVTMTTRMHSRDIS
ncbi:hypothetical protein BaRGS_00003153, partial [Batillaria attramentaria]